jgi:hypothetical protein
MDTLTASILESKPNISVYPQFGFSPTPNARDLTESGIAVKFTHIAGKSSRISTCDGDENVKLESETHPSKHCDRISSTDDGITRDLSDEHPENARESIDFSFASSGKVIIVSRTQS